MSINLLQCREFAMDEKVTKDKDVLVLGGGKALTRRTPAVACALSPMHLGVRAVIAKSIERIHMANLVNYYLQTNRKES
jgi:hypothetical protein